jgi:hypothetical protein
MIAPWSLRSTKEMSEGVRPRRAANAVNRRSPMVNHLHASHDRNILAAQRGVLLVRQGYFKVV